MGRIVQEDIMQCNTDRRQFQSTSSLSCFTENYDTQLRRMKQTETQLQCSHIGMPTTCSFSLSSRNASNFYVCSHAQEETAKTGSCTYQWQCGMNLRGAWFSKCTHNLAIPQKNRPLFYGRYACEPRLANTSRCKLSHGLASVPSKYNYTNNSRRACCVHSYCPASHYTAARVREY